MSATSIRRASRNALVTVKLFFNRASLFPHPCSSHDKAITTWDTYARFYVFTTTQKPRIASIADTERGGIIIMRASTVSAMRLLFLGVRWARSTRNTRQNPHNGNKVYARRIILAAGLITVCSRTGGHRENTKAAFVPRPTVAQGKKTIHHDKTSCVKRPVMANRHALKFLPTNAPSQKRLPLP